MNRHAVNRVGQAKYETRNRLCLDLQNQLIVKIRHKLMTI